MIEQETKVTHQNLYKFFPTFLCAYRKKRSQKTVKISVLCDCKYRNQSTATCEASTITANYLCWKQPDSSLYRMLPKWFGVNQFLKTDGKPEKEMRSKQISRVFVYFLTTEAIYDIFAKFEMFSWIHRRKFWSWARWHLSP